MPRRRRFFTKVKEISHYRLPFATQFPKFFFPLSPFGRRHRNFRSTIHSPALTRTLHYGPYTNKLDPRRALLAKDIKVTTPPPRKSAGKFIAQPSERHPVPRVCSLLAKRPDSFPVPPSCKSLPHPWESSFLPLLAPLPRAKDGPPRRTSTPAAARAPQAAVGRASKRASGAGASSQRWLSIPPRQRLPAPSLLPHFLPSFIPTPPPTATTKAKVSPAHKPDGGSDVTGHGAARSQSRHSRRPAPANRGAPEGGTSARRKFD